MKLLIFLFNIYTACEIILEFYYEFNFFIRYVGNQQFSRNRRHAFKYVGIVENGIIGTSKNVTKMKIKADVFITNWRGCYFNLKVILNYKQYI